MPVLPQVIAARQGKTWQQRYHFRGDVLRVSTFSTDALRYLVKHIGQSPMIMDTHREWGHAHPLEIYTALAVMRDEPEEVQQAARDNCAKMLQYVDLANRRFATTGVKDHPGVGNGRGQTKGVQRLDVDLSKYKEVEVVDWAADLQAAEVVVDPSAGDRTTLPCPFCEHIEVAKNIKLATRGLGSHIHYNHEDGKFDWKEKMLPVLREEGVDAYLEQFGLTTPDRIALDDSANGDNALEVDDDFSDVDEGGDEE